MFRGSLKRPFSNATNTLDRFPVYEPPVKQRTVIVGDDVDVAGCEAGTNKIKVYIRVRPENDKELRSRRVIEVIDDQSLLFDPMTDDDGYTYHGRKYKEIGKKVSKDLSFQFDSVFDEKTTNLQVYERAVKGFVPSLLDGFNCTIFAYGPTGSGKTFTMLGYDGDPGVIYYTAMELFHNIETRPSDEQYEVCVSYFEIYNEKVYDLLTPSDLSLKVVDNMGGGVNILGITVRSVNHADELIEQLETGNQYRAQQATDANATSSRSHAVFQLSLRKKKCSKGKQIITQEAKMCLVDLAGSERASVAYKENRSKTLHREGGNINKSLLALGNCINALASKCRKGGKVYIPYRSSVLTRILSDSLGGNCRTAMIATVSPSSLSYDDTHNTLTYANRTKGINLALKRRSMIIGIQPRHQALAIETLQQDSESESEEVAGKQKMKYGNIEYDVKLLHQTIIGKERFTAVKPEIYYEYSAACNPGNIEVPFIPERDPKIPTVNELERKTAARRKKRGSRIYVCPYCSYYFAPGEKASADRHVDGFSRASASRAPSCAIRKLLEPQNEDGSWSAAGKRPYISK